MQTADIMLALGGNLGQTVQKFGVTPAEVAVLREIHGEAAVFDIQPLDEEVERSSREERARLLMIYGKPPGSNEISAVDFLFPGAAARLFEGFDELDLDDSFYKATDRAKPTKSKAKAKKAKEPEPEEVEDEPEPEAVEPEAEPEEAEEPKAKKTPKKPGKSIFNFK
jgi:hypothetical protein